MNDLHALMRDLLAPDVAIPESDLADDWLDACKNAGVPASRYQSVTARNVLRELETAGDAIREVDRGSNGAGLPVTRWGGRGFVPRTVHVAVRVEPKVKLEPKRPKARNIAPPDRYACLAQELAQGRSQLNRIESQLQAGGCGATAGFGPSDDEAIAAWNRRAPSTLRTELEGLADGWQDAAAFPESAFETCADDLRALIAKHFPGEGK